MFDIFRRLNNRIGLDIGATTIRIYSYARDEIISEPSIIVYNRKRKVVAAGAEAEDMVGRTPKGIIAMRPVKNGLAVDPQALTDLLTNILDRNHITRAGIFKLKIDVCALYGLDDIEQTNIMKAVLGVGNVRATIVDKTLAAAFHEGYDGHSWDSMMLVNIGKDTSQAAVLSYGGVVSYKHINIGSGDIDQGIVSYLRRKYGVLISTSTAEEIKKDLGNACGSLENDSLLMFKAVDLASGMPRDMSVTAGEIQPCIDEVVKKIVNMVETVKQKTPYELLASIYEKGMTLTGGGAQLKGLENLISVQTGIKARLSKEPENGTVLGAIAAGQFMFQRSNIKRISGRDK